MGDLQNIIPATDQKPISAAAFLQSLRECAAVLSGVPKTVKEHSDFKRDVASLVELHSFMLERMIQMCQTPNALQTAIFRKKASVLVADMVGDLGKLFQYDAALMARCAEEVIPYVVERSDNVDILIDDIVSHDVIMNVKFSLLLASVKFQALYGYVPFAQSKRMAIQWFIQFSAELAKDLAFNWSKKASISDRHQLFQCALPICADLVQEAWASKAIELMKSEDGPEIFTGFTIWKNCPRLDAQIEAIPFVDSENQLISAAEAKMRIKPKLILIIQRYSLPDAHRVHNLAFLSGIARQLDSIAADAIPAMLAESGQGLVRVPVDDFIDSLEIVSVGGNLLKSVGSLDLAAVEHRAKSTLAYLWGLSNLVAKTID